MKKLSAAMALALLISAAPATADSTDTATMSEELVTKNTMEAPSSEPDTILTTLALMVFLMMAGGAF